MNKNLRMLLASVLALAMLLSLAACGDGGSKPGSAGKESTPAFVYTSSFREVEKDSADPMSALLFTDDGFYTTTSDVVGRREPKPGEKEDWEGQFDIREEGLAFVDFDGKLTKLANYTEFKPEELEGHDQSCELFKLARSGDGTLAAIYHVPDSWNDAPEGVTDQDMNYYDYQNFRESWFLRTMDATGRELSLAEIGAKSDEYFWVSAMAYEDGRLVVVTPSGLQIMNTDGSTASTIKINGYANTLFRLRDGTLCVLYNDEVNYDSHIAVLDLAKGRVSKTVDAPYNAYMLYPGGGDYELYYQSGVNVYGWNPGDDDGEKVFDWLNVDVLPQSLSGFTILPDGSFFAVCNNWDATFDHATTEFVKVERKNYDSVPHKEELTLACRYADSDLQNAVVKFNRTSNVRIRVVDYAQYDNETDWDAGLTKLTTEIMSGAMPDILALNGMPYQQLAAKGLLADLYPFLDSDAELKRDVFLPNVLRALEVDGKLCSTVTTFRIMTLAGSARVVGSEPGWNAEQLLAALATMPEGCTVLDAFTTSGDILRDVVTIDADYYIDWTTGKVNFDSQEFVDTLKLARLFPNSFDSMNFNWEEYQGDEQRIREGKQMLLRTVLYGFDDIQRYENMFGGELTYIGFPTASGVGSYLSVDSGYGITSKCADKQAAWSFLRTLMTEKALETGYHWGFPANRKLLEKDLGKAMTLEYEKDENGNFLLDENGEKKPVPHGGAWSEESGEIFFYALTQEQADKVMDLIRNTTRVYSANTAVLDIISEQTDAFFSGQKSAEEVAKLVQGKLSIYVNEQR